MDVKPNLGQVLPLATLRRRRALQYCFTPYYDPSKAALWTRRTVSNVVPILEEAVGAGPEQDVTQNQRSSYPPENYQDEITPDELAFFRSQCVKSYDKEPKKRGQRTRAGSNGETSAAAQSSQGKHKARASLPSNAVNRNSIASFLGVPPELPSTAMELPRLPSGGFVEPLVHVEDEMPDEEMLREQRQASLRRKHKLAARRERPQLQVAARDVMRTRVVATPRPPSASLNSTMNSGALELSKGPSVLVRRMAYAPPPPPDECPAWMRGAVCTEDEFSTGRFTPEGGFYVRPTMDDEFYSACSSRAIDNERDDAAGASKPALEAQLATYRRLSRPNVVAEATSTAEENRILGIMAKRDLGTPVSNTTASVSQVSPLDLSFGAPPKIPRSPGPSSVSATPVLGRSPKVTFLSPPPPLVGALRGGSSQNTPPTPSALEDQTLLQVRDALPPSSRSSGCVGAAEVHYWLEIGHQRHKEHKRDTEACIAQVWMKRSVEEESHSARAVLRNYASRVPNDAVLAVTLREVVFGKRRFDITVTFTYGEVKNDETLEAVANTIRTIVKDANNNDGAKFRGPFLVCSADVPSCEYMRKFCLAMCDAEHPEMAVLGFPCATASPPRADLAATKAGVSEGESRSGGGAQAEQNVTPQRSTSSKRLFS